MISVIWCMFKMRYVYIMIYLLNKTSCCTQNGVCCTIYVYKYRKQFYGYLETHLPWTKSHNPLKFKVKGLHCIEPDDDTTVPDDDTTVPEHDTTVPDDDTIELDADTTEPDDDTIELDDDTTVHDDDTIEPDNDTIELDDDTTVHDDDTIEPDNDTTVPDDDTIGPDDDTTVTDDDTAVSDDYTTVPTVAEKKPINSKHTFLLQQLEKHIFRFIYISL